MKLHRFHPKTKLTDGFDAVCQVDGNEKKKRMKLTKKRKEKKVKRMKGQTKIHEMWMWGKLSISQNKKKTNKT